MADPLDSDLILSRLGPQVRARMASLDVVPRVDSTNAELLRRPVPEGGLAAALLADCQDAGRGRRGKGWVSPAGGNLYLSLSRGFSGGPGRLEGLSLVAGIATAEALHALGYQEVRLKWPNDLVVAAPGGLRKLAGLLVEGAGTGEGQSRAVLGLGVNASMSEEAADGLDQPWCDLAGLSGHPPSASELAAAVLGHWVPALDQFDRTGLAPFLPRFHALDALAGAAVTVLAEGNAIAGVARGIAGGGALRVALEDGTERAFHSGEVSVRRAG